MFFIYFSKEKISYKYISLKVLKNYNNKTKYKIINNMQYHKL